MWYNSAILNQKMSCDFMNIFLLTFLLIFSTTCLQAMNSLEKATIRLFKGVNPIRPMVLHELPKDFFIENGRNSTVERINERTFYVHDNRVEEKENTLIASSDRELALFEKENGKVLDRRLAVINPTEPPYKAICFLRGIHNITPRDELIYYGTGFRNGLNQVVTCGHNLHVEEKIIQSECEKRKIRLDSYEFIPKNLIIETIFGFKGKEDGKFLYSHIFRTNVSRCFTHEYRDFGVVPIGNKKSKDLDESIGALSIGFLPEQPHEYIDKEVSIVGYPGEKTPIAMYFHSGPIRSINHRGVVHYEVDTSGGNSGSPGFLNLRTNTLTTSDVSDFPACLIHCHASEKPLNGGEKFDDELVKFMQDKFEKV